MEQVMPDFITYLTNERNASKSTVSSYCRDLERMFQFLDGKGIKKTDDVTPISLNSYILYLEKEGFSISTVSRNVASMKAYFHYAFGRRLIEKDPTRTIKAPHIEKRVPGVLTQEQVTRLLEQPSRNTAKGIRDKAMLELLYATGMRVSELIAVQMEDVNFSLEYVVCRDAERLRVIPLGGKAKEALKFYLKEARDRLLCGKKGGKNNPRRNRLHHPEQASHEGPHNADTLQIKRKRNRRANHNHPCRRQNSSLVKRNGIAPGAHKGQHCHTRKQHGIAHNGIYAIMPQ